MTAVLFVTNPMCSWCWGMAPDMLALRNAGLALEFRVLMGGLGIHNQTPMSDQRRADYQAIWQRVTATTGQTFCGRFPDDPFVYNSALPCQAVIAAQLQGCDALALVHALHHAFFLEARDITSAAVIEQVAATLAIDAGRLMADTSDNAVVEEARRQYQEAARYGTQALPSVLIEDNHGQRSLLAGGYIDAGMLKDVIEGWLDAHPQNTH